MLHCYIMKEVSVGKSEVNVKSKQDKKFCGGSYLLFSTGEAERNYVIRSMLRVSAWTI